MIAEFNRKTLDGAKLKNMRKQVKLGQSSFAKLSNLSRETVIKFEKGSKVGAGAKRGVVEAAMLLKGLAEIMEPENISEWLVAPNKNYRNKSPLELIGSGRSDIIWSMIERARQGTFA